MNLALPLVLTPTVTALLTFVCRSDRVRRGLLVVAAVAHAVLTGWAISSYDPALAAHHWLSLDAPGLLFLGIVSGLFLVASIYCVGYFAREPHGAHADSEEDFFFVNAPEAIFTGCLLLFLATMTLVCASQHFGLLWVAIEATTLASAPLIYFHRHHRSLEATWKYLLICSVGIALALLGNFFLAMAASDHDHAPISLALQNLIQKGPGLQGLWLRAAFLLFLVGYGTKMGLAPMHTWLPDAHSESPSVVSALLSGALLNCAFLGLLRTHQVCAAAGEGAFTQELFVVFGLLSMGLAAVFILVQSDYKRILAYSSTEHMGILALGVGLGGAGVFGSMLHALNHSLAKAMLFLLAGNILAVYQTRSSEKVHGMLTTLPVTAVLWLAGFLAITGAPPFGPFLSEFIIFKAALDQGHLAAGMAYLVFLALIFIGMVTLVLRMVQGEPDAALAKRKSPPREHFWALAPPALLAVGVLLLGVYLPLPLREALQTVARALGGP